MEIIQKSVLAISDPGVASLYTTRKAEQMETAITYFLKNLPSLTETFLDDFRTGPAEIFQNPFQLTQPGPPAMHWRGKTSSHIPRHFFAISKWGSRKFFDTALCSGRDATGQEKGAAL